MLRQARFMLCCAGVLLIYQTDKGWIFYVAGITAFANLFSAQWMCGMKACQTQKTSLFDPQAPITLIHYGSTIVGALFCLLGALKIWVL